MKHYKKIIEKGIAFALAASVMGTNNMAGAASIIGDKKIEAKQANAIQEQALKEAIRESDTLEESYPNGLFNFLGTRFEVKEEDEYLEICVIRQGGTKGEANVRFKAIDITSSYGDDYTIYTSKKKNTPIKKGEDAFPLIETAYINETDLSNGNTTEEVLDSAVENYAKQKKEQADSTQSSGNPLDQYPDAEKATSVNTNNTKIEAKTISNSSQEENAEKLSLRTLKEAYTGTESDRKDWKTVSKEEASIVRENYELFFDNIGGTETTLTFHDGEYVKYLYLFPKDDKEAEAEEQLICTLLPVEGDASIGESYHSYVNIVDNEEVEESAYEFEYNEIEAGEKEAKITIKRTKGKGYYDSIYIGTAEGSANPDADYIAGLKQIDFYAGQDSQTVTIDILENEYRDKDRDFYVLLSYDGEEYLENACHVIIPANPKGMSKAMATSSSATPEKISANGFCADNKRGQWGIPLEDMNYISYMARKDNAYARYQHTGGYYEITSKNVQLYGIEKLEFGFKNTGAGRTYQVHKYRYKNWWNKLWGKKTWYWEDVHEDNFCFSFYIGNREKSWDYGKVNWKNGFSGKLEKNDWNQNLRFVSYAGLGNQTNVLQGWVRTFLKEYNYRCVNPANTFKLKTYEPSINGKTTRLKEVGNGTGVTPTLSLASVSSNVNNNNKNPNASTKLFRSDALTFKLNNYNTSYLSFKGLEASADNRNWKQVSNNLNVVLNADFFKKFDLFSSNTIYFRPKFTQNKAEVKFILDKETKTYQKGNYTNVAENSTVTLNCGDTIKNIQGKSGIVASYQPVFYLNQTKGKNAFVQAASNKNLTLDSSDSAGSVAILKASAAYNEVKLAYADPTVTVQADPNTYRNTYTNLKYQIGKTTYDCSKTTDIENLHKVMEQNYKNNTDANITISFEYLANPEYKNGKGDQSKEFGTPKYAMLSVYDSNGELVENAPYKLDAKETTRNKKKVYTFSKSGSWKTLGWAEGTTATITIYGSKVVAGATMTSQETGIEFLSTSGNYAMVMDQGGNVLSDSGKNQISNIAKKLVFKNLNPLSTYKFVGMPSDNFITRWADYSLDLDSDGNASSAEVNAARKRLEALGQDADLIKGFTVYYGNSFSYQPSTYSQSKLYYDFVKKDTSTGNNNVVGIKLTKLSSTVLEPNYVKEEPLRDAQVLFAGTNLVSGDEDGCYADRGNYEKGKSYLADVKYENMNFQVAVQGTTYQEASIDTTEVMFPTDFSVSIDGEETDVKTNGNSAFVKIENKDTEFSFNFKSSIGVRPQKAKVTIYDLDGNTVLTDTLTRASVSEMFQWKINPAKMGIKPGCQMKIQGVYADETGDHMYPAVEVGLVFQAAFTIINVAASFKTPLSKPLKLFGEINTKFDLPLDYDLDNRANISEYSDENNVKIQTRQIAFGYNTDVMKQLKQQQIEHRAENKGNATSGRDNIKKYLEHLMEDDDDDDDDDDDVDKNKEQADQAQDPEAAASSTAGENSFQFDFSVALILTVESGVRNGKPDGQNYFDSLALIASGEAEYNFTVTYTTPIGIDIIASMGVSGKAVIAFGAESSNTSKYDDTFNLTKNGSEKGKFQLNSKNFSLYTKFLLAPSITVGGGVGVGGGIASVQVSGTADFNFGFTVPIMGNNHSSAGSGTVTLSADLKIKILFIKKSWNLYKSREMDLFSYGTQSVAEMLNDFEENYLYDEIEGTEVLSREYLKNRSKWQPYDISAKKVEAGKEVILEEGVYPYPQTKLVDLGSGKLLMLFIDDQGENGKQARNQYNRSELMYTISEDNGVNWKEPQPVDNDMTWDEAVDAFLVRDDKVLITWSDASKIYTEKDDAASVLSMLDISGAWFDINSMKLGEPFSITKTTEEDRFSDVNPKISYDEETQRLMVYYTKIDYYDEKIYDYNKNTEDIEGDQKEKEEALVYGDIINGYNVIAYRYAELQNGEFIWNETYQPEESSELQGLYGQRFLDLAIPATVTEREVTKETGEFFECEDGQGNITLVPVTETRIERDLIPADIEDPRIIDSDLISYNGLALYAYTMDFDQNLETTQDQQLYVQIYNYATNEFHHPIQITVTGSNSKPQFVRCKNMTYLYWIHDGDIQYLNITQVIRSLDIDQSYLKLKQIQKGEEIINIYILDKYEDDPVRTAIEHEKEIAEDGTVTENAISDFDIESNNNSMYILWTAMVTSEKKEDQSGVDNIIRETQVFGAYCEPEIELKEIEEVVTFEDDENMKYGFVEGKGNNTYPVSAQALKDVRDEETGEVVTAGSIVEYCYESDKEEEITTDVNGKRGLVRAGDLAIQKNEQMISTDGCDWSKPIQITEDVGANYTDLSFRVTGDNEIQAVFAKGTQALNENNCFEENEATKSLRVQTFKVISTIETSEITIDKEQYFPEESAEFGISITNNGLKPLESVTYRTYVKQNGTVTEDSNMDWIPLAEVIEAEGKTKNQFLGGTTRTVSGSAILGETIENTVFVMEVKDDNGEIITKEKELIAEAKPVIEVNNTRLVDKNTAELDISVSNFGNKDYKGDVSVTYQDKEIAKQEVEIPYGEKVHMTLQADIKGCSYGKLTRNEDGSKQDAIDIKVICQDVTEDAQIVRLTTREAGYASEAVQSFEIGASNAYEEGEKAKAVKGTLNINTDDVMALESLFTIDSKGEAAKQLAKIGLSADTMMTTDWESSDPSIAYISDKGILVPMKDGTVKITAKVYPKSDKSSAVPAVLSGVSSDKEEDFGQLIASDDMGYSVSETNLYSIPESLIQTKTIKVKIGTGSNNNTNNNVNNNTGNQGGSSSNINKEEDKKDDIETPDNQDNNNETKETIKEVLEDGTIRETTRETLEDGMIRETVRETAKDNSVIKETVTETAKDGSVLITIMVSDEKNKSILNAMIEKDENGTVTKTDAKISAGLKETSSTGTIVNVSDILMNALQENKDLDSVFIEITEPVVSSAYKNKNAVVTVNVDNVKDVEISGIVLTKESVAIAKEIGKKLTVNIAMENADKENYTVIIPAKQIKKIIDTSKPIDIMIKTTAAAKVKEISSKTQIASLMETVLLKNKVKEKKAYLLSVANNEKLAAGMKVIADVNKETTISTNQTVYVYKYNQKTGKFVEVANSKKKVSADGKVTVDVKSGTDYLVSAKKLTGSKVTSIKSKIKATIEKSSVKAGKNVKIKVTLPSELKKVKKFGASVFGKEQAMVSYQSSHKKNAVVTGNGTIKTKKAGNAIITIIVRMEGGQMKKIKKKIKIK